jgi:hypothetical protein
MKMFFQSIFKSVLGLAAVTIFLQLISTSNASAQILGDMNGPCRVEGGQMLGPSTYTFDIYMRVTERCWQKFHPSVIGTVQRGAPKCGKLITVFPDMMAWDFAAGPTPCIDNFELDILGQDKTLTFQYTVNISP